MTPSIIINAVSRHYGLSSGAIRGPRRSLRIATARHMAQYIMRTQLRMSYPTIGEETRRDHTTTMRGIAAMANKIERQDGSHADYQAILAAITKVECPICPACMRPFEGESISVLREALDDLTARLDLATATRAA